MILAVALRCVSREAHHEEGASDVALAQRKENDRRGGHEGKGKDGHGERSEHCNRGRRDEGTEARAHGSGVVFGVPVMDRSSLELFNSVVAVGQGTDGSAYHKRHLVPFGEYLPLDGLIRPITEALGLPVADFELGPRTAPLLTVAGQRLGVSVCYEIAFGNEILHALPEASALVTVSNDAWFGTSIGPHQHMQIARARAVETGRYLLRATNTGITAIVAPDGRIEGRVPQFEVQVLSGEIRPMTGMTPYARTGDWAVILLVALTMIAGIALARRRVRDA